MSSYIVSNKTINRIVSFLDVWDSHPKLKREIEKLAGKKTGEKGLNQIGKKLIELNCEAVSQRYNEKIDKKAIKDYKFNFEKCEIEQAFKHLCCLTYQMSEGNVPKTKLYKLLEKVANCLAYAIAWDYTDKLNLEWG